VVGTDTLLIRRFLNGDQSAFDELYRLHAEYVRRIVASSVRDPEESKECVQETWIHAWKGLSNYHSRATFRVWLWTIARNVMQERWRRDWRWERKRSLAAEARTTINNALLESIAFHDAVGRMPPGMRGVLMLSIDGYRHADIAATLGIAEGTSKSQLAKARNHLRRLLS
jgi:RNA polymerase sigma-70 factor (ECF subfamily)